MRKRRERQMATVTVRYGDGSTRTSSYGEPVTILRACADMGVSVYAPCGGRGVCGGCKIKARGALSAMTEAESARLTERERADGVRLACMAYAVGDVEVFADDDVVSRAGMRADGVGNIGVAVDIGTTTVAVSAVDMVTGVRIGELTRRNPQSSFGADVISRITAVGKYGVDALRAPLCAMIDDMRHVLGAPDGARTVVVGNTTMLSIWAGIDPTPIGTAPFTPPTLFGFEMCGAYVPRCVSSYVGADAVASALAAGLYDEDNVVACDIGTNGEVIAKEGGVIRACAAAAGPALEGAGIECGMAALPGAIDSVTFDGVGIDVHTVGDADAIGICGSGLISAAAALHDMGALSGTGVLRGGRFELADGVYITQSDIRALQLAKGAVRAAVDTVCGGADKLCLSGGFGSGLDIGACVRIGLVPSALAENVTVLGNGAIRGAEMMLTSDEFVRKADEIAKNAAYIELSGSSDFESRFVECIDF